MVLKVLFKSWGAGGLGGWLSWGAGSVVKLLLLLPTVLGPGSHVGQLEAVLLLKLQGLLKTASGSDTFFWPPQTPHTCCTFTQTYRHVQYIQKQNWWCSSVL